MVGPSGSKYWALWRIRRKFSNVGFANALTAPANWADAMTSAERAEFSEALAAARLAVKVGEKVRQARPQDGQAEMGSTPCIRGHRSSIGVVLSPHVVELEVRERYRIWVGFDDGAAGVVDLSDSASLGGIFSQWSDDGFWRSAHIVADSGAVAWGNGSEVDVCPLSLYLDVTGQAFEDLGAEAATTGAA